MKMLTKNKDILLLGLIDYCGVGITFVSERHCYFVD